MSCHITRKIIFHNKDFGATLFHPKVTLDKADGSLLMTVQTVHGSDYFGPVQFSVSKDRGETWSAPENIPSLDIEELADSQTREGTCDVVPDYHPQTDTILAIGHNVYYHSKGFLDTLQDFSGANKNQTLQRYGVYAVRKRSGEWSPRRRLEFPEFAEYSSFVCGCGQKIILPDGNLLIPFYLGPWGRRDRMCCTFLCSFDGTEITLLKRGNLLELPVDRGLLEPSIIDFAGKFYLTLRAEDGHGHFSQSDDGLNWLPIKAWQWEDGEKLIMSTTQQHWMKLGGKLFLTYTRNIGVNKDVMRWRTPLLIAEFDPEKGCLKKDTEMTILPMRELESDPKKFPLMGNFHPCHLSENEGIITVGENIPGDFGSGNTLLARIRI